VSIFKKASWKIVIALVLVASIDFATAGTEELRRGPVVRSVESAGPAVVNIYTESTVASRSPFSSPRGADPFSDGLFGEFFGGRQPQSRKRNSLGSGVLVDPSGIVVTNEHVIVRADTIRVQLSDQREYTAHLIGSDSDADLAVLRIDADGALPHIRIGEEDSLMIGETVIAIGNPFGLTHTVTTGVLSAIGRTFAAGEIVYQDFLQTDASINPGNSGGPLLDVTGRLIGINTAVHPGGQGIGFAIPLWRVRNIVEQILDHGTVLPAWTGLFVQSLDRELAAHFGVAIDAGALVRDVEPSSPAALAGIQRGEIITHVQGGRIRSYSDFQRRAQGLSAGDKFRVRVGIAEKHRDVIIDIDSVPAARIDEFSWAGLGLKVQAADHRLGAAIESVRRDSPAARVGLRPGDIVAGMGGVELNDLEDYRKALARHRGRNNILLAVIRGRSLYRLTLPVER
jgi:serine protease Do